MGVLVFFLSSSSSPNRYSFICFSLIVFTQSGIISITYPPYTILFMFVWEHKRFTMHNAEIGKKKSHEFSSLSLCLSVDIQNWSNVWCELKWATDPFLKINDCFSKIRRASNCHNEKKRKLLRTKRVELNEQKKKHKAKIKRNETKRGKKTQRENIESEKLPTWLMNSFERLSMRFYLREKKGETQYSSHANLPYVLLPRINCHTMDINDDKVRMLRMCNRI